jgi:Family of unknown function (DUF5654)
MSDYPQYPNMQGGDMPPPGSQGSAPQRRLMGGIDPRRALDPATVERMIRAQVAARTQAQAATTVVLATIVSLITSAFSFVAALAWNSAIQDLLKENFNVKDHKFFGVAISNGGVEAIYAFIVTIIAVVVVVILNRIARRYASKSALSNGN